MKVVWHHTLFLVSKMGMHNHSLAGECMHAHTDIRCMRDRYDFYQRLGHVISTWHIQVPTVPRYSAVGRFLETTTVPVAMESWLELGTTENATFISLQTH